MAEQVSLWVSGALGAETQLAKAEDAAHASGDFGIVSLGVRKDTATSLAGSDGDYTAPIFDADGKLWVTGTSGGGAVTVADGADVAQGATTGAAVITDAAGTLQQYLRGLVKLAITAGSFLVRATVASGGVASGAIATGAIADMNAANTARTTGTLVLPGQLVGPSGKAADVDASGNLLVSLGTKLDSTNDSVKTVAGAVNSACVTGHTAAIADTNATAVIAAQGAGVKIYLTSLVVTNSDATVGTLVTIQDGADTPIVLCKGYAAPAGGGFAITFPTPPSTTANKALNAICGTTSAEVYVSAVGFTAA
jgi:hypothetical protein